MDIEICDIINKLKLNIKHNITIPTFLIKNN